MNADEAVWLDLGLALYRRRIERGIDSQRELAKLAGVHHNTISRLERGQPWTRRGRAWTAVERTLGLPDGWISAYVASHSTEASEPVLSAEVVEQVVLEAMGEHAPHVTIRQARSVAAGVAKRLGQRGYLPDGRG